MDVLAPAPIGSKASSYGPYHVRPIRSTRPSYRPRRPITARSSTNEHPIQSRASTEVPVVTDPPREPSRILDFSQLALERE